MADSSRRVLPGLGLTLGFTVFYTSVLVVIPLAALAMKSAQIGWGGFLRAATTSEALSAYRVSFLTASAAMVVNSIFGLIVAWVLVRYRFPCRRLFDALVDFPFALPTAVSGLTFASMYAADGWFGRLGVWFGSTPLWPAAAWLWNLLAHATNAALPAWDAIARIGNRIIAIVGLPAILAPAGRLGDASPNFLVLSNTNWGIVIVLIFVGFPFVVRAVQPILQDLDKEVEEAAAGLGASPLTAFRRVIFPAITPAWLSGLALSFARAIGEYGSVVFIAANIPGRSQIAPLQIMSQLDSFRYSQATAISVVLLSASLAVLLFINGIEWWMRRTTR